MIHAPANLDEVGSSHMLSNNWIHMWEPSFPLLLSKLVSFPWFCVLLRITLNWIFPPAWSLSCLFSFESLFLVLRIHIESGDKCPGLPSACSVQEEPSLAVFITRGDRRTGSLCFLAKACAHVRSLWSENYEIWFSPIPFHTSDLVALMILEYETVRKWWCFLFKSKTQGQLIISSWDSWNVFLSELTSHYGSNRVSA